MPRVSTQQSEGIRFSSVPMYSIFVFEGDAYVRSFSTSARHIEDETNIDFEASTLVIPATKVHVEY